MSTITLIKTLAATALLASAAAHAAAPRIEQLPRVVITGKAVTEVAQLPRVVITGSSEATLLARQLSTSAAQYNSAAKRG